jgi:hypothetical protein
MTSLSLTWLFKTEIKEELSAYLRDGLILGLGELVITVGSRC